MEQTEINQYYAESGQPELCEKLSREALDYMKQNGYKIEVHQKKALLNHLTEMVKRDNNQEQLNVEDKEVFAEIADDSIEAAKGIVSQLKHVSGDEVYLLAVHFEVVKFN